MEKNIKGLKVAILATDGFEESELILPMNALRDAGADVEVVSLHEGEIQGYKHLEKGQRVAVDALIHGDAIDLEYEALVLPGGTVNADALRAEPEVIEFLKSFDGEGKPIAAICHAPWELISAGLVKGRRLTSYHSIQDDVRNAGGEWVNGSVIRDRNWVTSRQPSDIPDFNREMIALFSEARHSIQQSALAH